MSDYIKGKTILIVEDEDGLREPLVMELESLGCKVFEARNGREGFEIVKREKIDAVISDIRMPGGDGVELLTRIKQRDHAVPVVMLITGFSDLSREEAYDLGAEVILSKPFDLDELDAAVIKILTPVEIRWQPAGDPKAMTKKIERTYSDLVEATKKGDIALGRGGFFIRDPVLRAKNSDTLSFHIRFQTGEILSLEGDGVVRWIRMTEQDSLPPGVGIEFNSLIDPIRHQVAKLTDSLRLVPFIPKGPRH